VAVPPELTWQSALARVPRPVSERAAALVHRSSTLRAVLHRSVLKGVQFDDVEISKGPAKGLHFNASGGPARYALGEIEPEVQALMQRVLRPGDVFYDVGASIGFFTVLGARVVGPEGRVVAVEPFPDAADRLRRNVELNGFASVTVEQAAVADTSRQGTFVGGEKLVWGWLLREGEARGAEGVEVSVVTIDDLVARGTPPPSMIKLDVEGAEVLALRGAADTLARIRPAVVCETHGTRAEVVALLEAQEYVVTGLDEGPLAADAAAEPLGKGWFDHVFARPRERLPTA